MRQLPLEDLHSEAGAKFGPFGGFDMPLFYRDGTIKEHLHTREAAGLFDISHMAIVSVAGPDASALIERLCPYPASQQENGRSRYTFFLNETAGVIDDLIVTRLSDDRFQIVCNAACADKDLEHVRHYAPKFEVNVETLSRVFLALQGPKAEDVLISAGLDCSGLKFMDAIETSDGWFVSRSGYTGEDGFEIALPGKDADAFARQLVADDRVKLVGLAARDTLRLEAGLPLYGQDLAADITPMEAGLAWAIPKTHREGGDFVGALAVGQKFQSGRARKRVGMRPAGQTPVRAHTEILAADGESIGEVTSGGYGPSVGHPIAFGLLESDYAGPIHVERRGKRIELETAKLPFVPHRYRK